MNPNVTNVTLGSKVRQLREAKNLSQSELCGASKEASSNLTDIVPISTKQLGRIERGESSPTIKTLLLIANGLSVSVAQILSDEPLPSKLPREFLKLKNQLTFLALNDNPDHIKKQAVIFKKINYFYNALPAEEKLYIDVKQMISQTYLTKKIAKATEDFVRNELPRIANDNPPYNETGLLLIQLYFYICFYETDILTIFEKILSQIAIQAKNAIYLEAVVLSDILICAMGIFVKNNQYSKLSPIIDISKHLIAENQLFHKEPIISMLEGKSYLFAKKHHDLAKEKYLHGAKIAKEIVKNQHLAKQILLEWESDRKRINLSQHDFQIKISPFETCSYIHM